MKTIFSFPLTLTVVVVITYLSFFTPPPTRLDDVVGIDKVFHTIMYAGFAAVLLLERWRLYRSAVRALSALWVVVFPASFGGLMELGQAYLSGGRRSGDWWDFAFNTAGSVLVYLIVRWSVLCRDRR